MSLPLRLKNILLSSPPAIDPNHGIPGDYQLFLVVVRQAFTKLWSLEPAILRAAVAPEWKALWSWMRVGLRSVRISQDHNQLPEEMHNRIMSMISSLTFVLACILYGMDAGSCGDVNGEFKITIFDAAPDILELLAMALMVPFQFQSDDTLQMMMEFADPLLSLDDDTMVDFVNEIEKAALRATGQTFLVVWKTRIDQEFLELGNGNGIDCLRLSYFLLFLKFPICGNSTQLSVVSGLWPHLYKTWRILISKNVHLILTKNPVSERLRLDCIRQILVCQRDWIAGGFRWVALALDNWIVTMIARTAQFLSRCGYDSEYQNEILGMFEILRNLIEDVHVYRMYHCVSYRVERNLKPVAGGRRSKATLRIGRSDQEQTFNITWGKLWNEFGDLAKIVARKRRWDEVLLRGCVICQRSVVQAGVFSRPHSCSRCGISVYCSKPCQRRDYYDHGHKAECIELSKFVNMHPLHCEGEAPGSAMPFLEKQYVLAWLKDVSTELVPRIDSQRDKGKSEAIIVDFMSLEPEYEVSDLRLTLEEFEPSVRNEIEGDLGSCLYCGRVPLSDCVAMLLPLLSVH